MVKHCLKEKSEFGMLLSLPKGVVRVGCTAEIAEVAKRYDDGRMDILTVGRAPFRAVELFTENPLLEGHVDYLEDREAPPNPCVQRELVELFEACHTLIYDDYPKNLARTAPEELSYLVCRLLLEKKKNKARNKHSATFPQYLNLAPHRRRNRPRQTRSRRTLLRQLRS